MNNMTSGMGTSYVFLDRTYYADVSSHYWRMRLVTWLDG